MALTFGDLKKERVLKVIDQMGSDTKVSDLIKQMDSMNIEGFDCYYLEKQRKTEPYGLDDLNSYLDFKSKSINTEVEDLTIGDMLKEKQTPFCEIELETIKFQK